MSELSGNAPPQARETTHNQFAYSVSEISFALKRVVEDNFGQVRVRGEISGLKVAASGHGYLKLKDENAVIDAVCWKGVMGKMAFKPEDGLEVICSGRLTTYPGRSNYQLVIDSLEPAGAGALMALLEKLKQKLAAEGLFDQARKKPLPFMPRVIGVITSPTGAVIRDILHRLQDRFPSHVIVWPVLVQGEGAEQQIVAAIEGFNAINRGPEDSRTQAAESSSPRVLKSSIPRPDLLIVARGGGSLEDLWAFNLESVVRAAAASVIPLISAVGHETDTTLIDYVSDMRAPTPTAAAELAVPVRMDWLLTLNKHYDRLLKTVFNEMRSRQEILTGYTRGLLHPRRLLEQAAQRLDDWSERHMAALPALLAQRSQQLAVMSAKLEPRSLLQNLIRHDTDIIACNDRLLRMVKRGLQDREAHLSHYLAMLESLSPLRVLERGFVMVKDSKNRVITRASAMKDNTHTLIFHDGQKVVHTS